jgi:hypothetical protein
MPVNRFLLPILLSLLTGSCVEPFEPELREPQEMLVVYGVITDQPGIHSVEVSLSTPYSTPSHIPVQGCIVGVEDELGQRVGYQEVSPGHYEGDLPASFLRVGKSYAVTVISAEGKLYRSDYDTLLACPPVDKVYYEVQRWGTSDPEVNLDGIQFFCDVTGDEDAARNYRWLVEATWEYRAPYTSTYIYMGGPILPLLEDTVSTCYKTEPIASIFTASTKSLSVNGLRKNTLNRVTNETPRLQFTYSLYVKQQSLTNAAFEYWDQLKSMTSETGGLYETQPPITQGNLYNVADPQERVLGYFYATQPQEKRIFVDEEFDFYIPRYECTLDTIERAEDLPSEFPVYLFSLNPMGAGPPFLTGGKDCFDCRKRGGTNHKPDFWE